MLTPHLTQTAGQGHMCRTKLPFSGGKKISQLGKWQSYHFPNTVSLGLLSVRSTDVAVWQVASQRWNFNVWHTPCLCVESHRLAPMTKQVLTHTNATGNPKPLNHRGMCLVSQLFTQDTVEVPLLRVYNHVEKEPSIMTIPTFLMLLSSFSKHRSSFKLHQIHKL